MSCQRSSLLLKMMAFCSLEIYHLEGEHVLSEVVPVLEDDGVLLVKSLLPGVNMSCRRLSPFLKMMAFCSSEVYYLESEHVLTEVVPVLEDDGVLIYRSLLPGE